MNKKLTEKQERLLAVLPSEIKEGSCLMSDKLVLAFIIKRHGTEYAREFGRVRISGEAMMENTEIKSKSTLNDAVSRLKRNGYITTLDGDFKKKRVTEYILTDKGRGVLEQSSTSPDCTENCTDISPDCTENCTDTKSIEERLTRIEVLLSLLLAKIGAVSPYCTENCTENCTETSDAKCATITIPSGIVDYKVPIDLVPDNINMFIKNPLYIQEPIDEVPCNTEDKLNKNLYKPEVPVDKVPVSKEKINQKENEVSLSQVPGSKKKINSDEKKMEPSVLQGLQNEGVADHSFSFKNFSSFEVPQSTGASGHEVPSSLKENKETLSQVTGTSKESCKFERAEERHREVVLPQKLRIDAWSENPQIQEYEDAEGIVVTNLEEFEAEAYWFEEDIRAKVTCDEWFTYLCTHFNNVREAWAEHFTSLPEVA